MLVCIINVMLVNVRFSRYWKHSLIQRIPKKNFDQNDLSTLRDISLLPVCFKIMSKDLCNRLLPMVSDKIHFWQRAFLNERDRQELIFALKTIMDDFRHLSTKLHIVFIDFADAFGSVKHEYIIETLRHFNIPEMYIGLIEDLYKFSSFNVICGIELTELFYIIRGTKTGDPLSALIFILVIDRVCRPMVSLAKTRACIPVQATINPLPVQAFADDIALSSYNISVIKDMITASEPILEQAGLDAKLSKSAVFYDRRSGNNWYRGKNDANPEIIIQGKLLRVYGRNEPYKYLGKSFALSGEDPLQVEEIIDTYKTLVTKIKLCELPLQLKCCALNNLALAKVLHHIYNTRFSVSSLEDMDGHLVDCVRELYGMHKSTTQISIFLPRDNGGLGIKRISNVYYTTRLSFLVKILNHEVQDFQHIARESLKLDMKKRGVKVTDSVNNFLGYELGEDGFLKCNTKFGCQSDWPEMVRYARKLGVKVVFENDTAVVMLNDTIISQGSQLQKSLYALCTKKDLEKATTLSIQGPFYCLINVNKKISNTILYNWVVNDDLIKFVIKARLSILPTNFTTYIWNRENNPYCPFGCFHTESIAHLLNGCISTFGNFYSRKHDRGVSKLFSFLEQSKRNYTIYSEKQAETIFPQFRDELLTIEHRRPDIIAVNVVTHECIIVEVTVCFDVYLDKAHDTKVQRYNLLVECLNSNGYITKLLVLCFGSLGSVRTDVWNCLRMFSDDKVSIKNVLKYCSISNIIGSNYIWRSRVKKILA